MKKVIITYFDKDIENYSNPQITNYSEIADLKFDLKNGIRKLMKLEELQNFVHKNLKVVGIFDNATGELVLSDEVIDLDALLILRPDFVESLKKTEELVGN